MIFWRAGDGELHRHLLIPLKSRTTKIAERKEARKQRFIETAVHLFVTHGYSATTAPTIVQESDSSTGSFYSYFMNAAAPLMPVSDRAWIPAGVCIVLTVARTVLEDRTLRRELPGYAAFAEQTRGRLIPGVWYCRRLATPAPAAAVCAAV